MKFLKSSAFKITLSAVVIFLIFRAIGAEEIYAALLSANIYYIAISFALVLQIILLKSIRWRNIAAAFNIKIGLVDSVNYTLISYAFAFITPGRVGEFIKTKYLADKSNAGYFKSFITVAIDKIFDLIALLGSALLGIVFLDISLPFSDFLIFPFALYAVALVSTFLFFEKALKLAKYLIPKRYRDNLKVLSIRREFYLTSLGMSFLIWVILSAAAFFILRSLGIFEASLTAVMIAVPLMAFSSQLPISFGGIGIRELAAIYFLSSIGVTPGKSAAFSLIYTFVSFVAPAIIGAVFYARVKAKKSIDS